MNSKIVFFFMIMCCCSVTLFAQTNTGKKQTSTNPVFDGWYADPEGVVFGDKYWIYPTYSAPFEQQLYMDAFSSPDLVHWRKHPKVLSVENISWLRNALWAPAVIEANGKYYFYFGANNIYHERFLTPGMVRRSPFSFLYSRSPTLTSKMLVSGKAVFKCSITESIPFL